MMESSSSDDSRHEIKSPEPCEKSDSGLNSSRTRLRLLASLLDEMCSKGKTRRASGLEVVWTLLHVMWFRYDLTNNQSFTPHPSNYSQRQNYYRGTLRKTQEITRENDKQMNKTDILLT
ncbi:hypothetical protein TNIN_88751 [Trichonephila inaurata madagascariensis]|uniref:Uncharacterized protein n=1 Tax=Trichonephila inaurata madagascariensis TaxID=2747483 RepID=A0A8X6XWS4_9ARAC|nr:hypothetical protein TNIN_88751 [Trichonephila inaurata madagascariensis]